MQLDIAHMLMADPKDIGLIPLQSRKGGFLKLTHDDRLLAIRGIIIRMERHHAGRVPPFAGVAVDQMACQVGITGDQFWQHLPPDGLIGQTRTIFRIGGDLFSQQIFHCCSARSIAMTKETHHHRECSAMISASWRSSVTRSDRTAIRSKARPALRSVFNAREIWLRLLPARPTAASRTRSTSGGRARRRIGSLDSRWRA